MNKNKIDKSVECLPHYLKSTQEWFAGIITQRLNNKNGIQPFSPNGMLIAEEAARYIVPSMTLKPHQRIQIYNQQYWWRLLNTLHLNFPLVTRLFGFHAFNEEIGIPYLLKYPPNHWSLTRLGERLSKWIEENYHKKDRPFIHNAVNLDWAFIYSAVSPHYPALNLTQLIQEDPQLLLTKEIMLQPHIQFFKWDYDLLSFREKFLKHDVDYWTEHRFPALSRGKTFYYMLYRNLKNQIAWRETSKEESFFLQIFKSSSSVGEACEHAEKQEEGLYEKVATQLQHWLQDWMRMGWFTDKIKEQRN